MKDPESVLYSSVCEDETKDVPLTVKRSAIDLQCFLERCKEEQMFLLKEWSDYLLTIWKKQGTMKPSYNNIRKSKQN